MSLFESYTAGLSYEAFLGRYGTPAYLARWQQTYDSVTLTPAQFGLLGSFKRTLKVLCLAGAWCGDCSGQCPIFQRFAQAAPTLQMRYLDRDEHAEVQEQLRINGGNRVPVLVFFSEDGFEISRYGERPLSKYRQMMIEQTGAACPTGIGSDPLLTSITAEWLAEFERAQYIARLSPRLRQKYGD